ncbi:MAG TPA: ABC transporter permease [Burkholderiales bacterium]|jgi:ribose transport system permease protein|nr:ABC transporter permease [Burkholderiales bacterium]
MKVSPQEIAQRREHSPLRTMIRSQPFWVTVALALICVVMSQISNVFFTEDNFFNVTRNFAFIGIIAMGMTAVIITGGIDLSVGSVVGLSGIVTGMVLNAGHSLWAGIAAGLLTALLCGLVNGILIAYVRLSPFIVTLGMFGIARSLAQVLSENHMIYEFGPDEKLLFTLGGGTVYGFANPFILLAVLTVVFMIVFRYTTWGRWVFALGGNEHAAHLTGVPVNRMKLSVYMLSALMAGISAVLLVSWQGAAINAMGTGYELRVIASSVIGGADLMGGAGGAYGAFIGAALIEVIRNSLLLAGVDANWEGTFVGLFIVFAVLLSKFRGMRSG